jgi:competence protein ComEA
MSMQANVKSLHLFTWTLGSSTLSRLVQGDSMTHLSRRIFALTLAFASLLSLPITHARAAAFQNPPAKTASVADKLDINTATPDQLKALKGIGDAYSKRIIDGRPYTAKNQLTTRGILPPATYNAIKDQIVAKAPKK